MGEGGAAIAASLRHNHAIKDLEIEFNHLTDEAKALLQEVAAPICTSTCDTYAAHAGEWGSGNEPPRGRICSTDDEH